MPKLDRNAIAKLPGPPTSKFDIVHWDDELSGLGLRILKSGTRSWVVRYRVARRQRVVTLGKIAMLSPGQAKAKASEILAQAKLGKDFQVEKQSLKSNDDRLTFGSLMDQFLSRYADIAQSQKTRSETRRLLAKWHHLDVVPVEEVTRSTIAEGLGKVEQESGLVTRNRTRSALSRLFSWALEEGLAEHNPVVGTARRPEKPRERVLSDDELGAIWSATANPGDHNAIVRLLMLTGQRREEVAAARWTEIDAKSALWRIPAERTKNKRAHEVPLSKHALAIFGALAKRESRDLIFGEADGPFSGWSKSKERLDRRSSVSLWTLHDLRRTVVTGMAEIGVQPHIVEAVVNHLSGHKSGVAGIYNRATYAEEKRNALQKWAEHLASIVDRAT